LDREPAWVRTGIARNWDLDIDRGLGRRGKGDAIMGRSLFMYTSSAALVVSSRAQSPSTTQRRTPPYPSPFPPPTLLHNPARAPSSKKEDLKDLVRDPSSRLEALKVKVAVAEILHVQDLQALRLCGRYGRVRARKPTSCRRSPPCVRETLARGPSAAAARAIASRPQRSTVSESSPKPGRRTERETSRGRGHWVSRVNNEGHGRPAACSARASVGMQARAAWTC
jgi:hypothetical protein